MMRKFAIVGLLTILLMIGIFHQALVTFSAEWLAKLYVSSVLGQTLHYQSASSVPGRLILEKPYLNDGSEITANTLTIDWDYQFWQRKVQVTLTFDRFSWKWQSGQPEALTQRLLEKSQDWFDVQTKWIIPDGIIDWHLPEQESPQILHLALNLDSQAGGELIAQFDGSLSDLQQPLKFNLTGGEDQICFQCNCDQVSAKSFYHLIAFFVPSWQSFHVSSGLLTGEMKAIFTSARRPYLEGSLYVADLKFREEHSHIQGSIDGALLKCQKNNQLDQALNWTTKGELSLLKPASLCCQKQDRSYWQFNQIQGTICFDPFALAWINLVTEATHGDYRSSLSLIGEANLSPSRPFHLALEVSNQHANQQIGYIRLGLQQGASSKKLAIECQDVACHEVDLIQSVLEPYWSAIKTLQMQDGSLSAGIQADLTKRGFENLLFHNLRVEQLKLTFNPWKFNLQTDLCSGHGQMDLTAPDIWHSLTTELTFENGQVGWNDQSSVLFPLGGLYAYFNIEEGDIRQSTATVEVGGLKGILKGNWEDNGKQLILNLEGPVTKLAKYFPVDTQKIIEKNFEHNLLGVTAKIVPDEENVYVEGDVRVYRDFSNQFDQIQFGCLLKPETDNWLKWINWQPIGWFYAKSLSLEKFISPFIFDHSPIELKGISAFKGHFTSDGLTAYYRPEHLVVEAEDFLISMDHVDEPDAFPGVHHLYFATNSHEGILPIQQGAYYLEKNSGLVFEVARGTTLFQNQVIYIADLEADCEGVSFQGVLNLDYSDPAPNVFSVEVFVPTINGKVSQIKHLLAHLNEPHLLDRVPLEGDIEARENGLHLRFDFVPHDYDLYARAKGTITNATLPIADTKMVVQGLGMDFEYCHDCQELTFTDIQGSLLVGKSPQIEEYVIAGDLIHFKDLLKGHHLDLDMWVQDDDHQLVRFAAQAREKEDHLVHLTVNKALSHFGGTHPQTLDCILREWDDLEEMSLDITFDLSLLLADLQRLSRAGLANFPQCWQMKFGELQEAKGQIQFRLQYLNEQDLMSYQLQGSQIALYEWAYDQVLLEGRRQQRRWLIDQLQLDHLSLSAELHHEDPVWKIDFLGLKDGISLLLGLNGQFDLEANSLKANIHLLDMQLAYLNEWPSIQAWASSYQPSGTLKGTGTLSLCIKDDSQAWQTQLDLETQLNHLSLRGYPLQVKEPFNVHYESGHACQFKNMHVNILGEQVSLKMDQLCYQIPSHQIIGEQLIFYAEGGCLKGCLTRLAQHFPEWVTPSLQENLGGIKPEGFLEGACSFAIAPQGTSLDVHLKDGLYQFGSQQYALSQFQVLLDPQSLHFLGYCQHERCLFHFNGHANWPTVNEGLLLLSDPSMPHPLEINWIQSQPQNYRIRTAKGAFCGLYIDLHDFSPPEEHADWMNLQGTVAIDFNRLAPLLSQSDAVQIGKLDVDNICCLDGSWRLPIKMKGAFLNNLYFKGKAASQDFVFKGYQFQQLKAEVSYDPGNLQIHDLAVEDESCLLNCSILALVQDPLTHSWSLLMPHLKVRHLQPNLLKDHGQYRLSKHQNLIVRRFDLEDFNGQLGDVSTWQGNGSLHFINPARQNVHPLFAIPAELILRLGLNPNVLNPVTGTIYFQLRGDRFYLTRFKDVYSEGRGSKFYLARHTPPSWVNLDGDLSVYVRMKQYNLIFKIAELFTVSVQGNLNKPRYRLWKQPRTTKHAKPVLLMEHEGFEY